MTLVNLPAPTGVPQLVVTSKEACVVDAHEQDKVLVRLRKGKKESCCASSTLRVTEGNWKLELRGTKVYCYFADDLVRGTWRAELLPSAQDGKMVSVELNGFDQIPWVDFDHKTVIVIVCSLLVFGMAIRFNTELLYQQTSQLEDRMILSLRTFEGNVFHLLKGWKVEPGPVGPPGLQGEPGKDCKTPPPPLQEPTGYVFAGGVGDGHTEFPKFRPLRPSDIAGLETKPLSEDCIGKMPIFSDFVETNVLKNNPATVAVLKPGTELKTGEKMVLGDHALEMEECTLLVTTLGHVGQYGSKKHSGPCIIAMQHDGNLVMYHPEKGAVWASRDAWKRTCPWGVTAKDGRLDCYEAPEKNLLSIQTVATNVLGGVVKEEAPYTTNFVAPGHSFKGAPSWRLGDYQLGLRGCDIVMFSLKDPQKDRVIVSKRGTDCSLQMRGHGDLILFDDDRGLLWSSMDAGMPACLKGMTVNKEGFLNCVK